MFKRALIARLGRMKVEDPYEKVVELK